MGIPRISLEAFVFIVCAWDAAMAQQKTPVEVGVLACSLSEAGPVETGRTGAEVQERDMLCVFKLRSGTEETYTGKVRGVSLAREHNRTLLWFVDAPSNAAPPAAGLLQQSYALDAVVLRWMGDGTKASVGASEKSPAADLVILGVELKLNSTAG
jgi:hypothetical protein